PEERATLPRPFPLFHEENYGSRLQSQLRQALHGKETELRDLSGGHGESRASLCY
ncbi:hypothetical protein HispidOSU_022702, partial [Sigmodon hispidus]